MKAQTLTLSKWVFLVAISTVVVILASGFINLRREYHQAMFEPTQRDFSRMESALAKRFGEKVRLRKVVMVNRDVAGIVGEVDRDASITPGIYPSPEGLISFEWDSGRTICTMAREMWQVDATRRTYRHR